MQSDQDALKIQTILDQYFRNIHENRDLSSEKLESLATQLNRIATEANGNFTDFEDLILCEFNHEDTLIITNTDQNTQLLPFASSEETSSKNTSNNTYSSSISMQYSVPNNSSISEEFENHEENTTAFIGHNQLVDTIKSYQQHKQSQYAAFSSPPPPQPSKTQSTPIPSSNLNTSRIFRTPSAPQSTVCDNKESIIVPLPVYCDKQEFYKLSFYLEIYEKNLRELKEDPEYRYFQEKYFEFCNNGIIPNLSPDQLQKVMNKSQFFSETFALFERNIDLVEDPLYKQNLNETLTHFKLRMSEDENLFRYYCLDISQIDSQILFQEDPSCLAEVKILMEFLEQSTRAFLPEGFLDYLRKEQAIQKNFYGLSSLLTWTSQFNLNRIISLGLERKQIFNRLKSTMNMDVIKYFGTLRRDDTRDQILETELVLYAVETLIHRMISQSNSNQVLLWRKIVIELRQSLSNRRHYKLIQHFHSSGQCASIIRSLNQNSDSMFNSISNITLPQSYYSFRSRQKELKKLRDQQTKEEQEMQQQLQQERMKKMVDFRFNEDSILRIDTPYGDQQLREILIPRKYQQQLPQQLQSQNICQQQQQQSSSSNNEMVLQRKIEYSEDNSFDSESVSRQNQLFSSSLDDSGLFYKGSKSNEISIPKCENSSHRYSSHGTHSYLQEQQYYDEPIKIENQYYAFQSNNDITFHPNLYSEQYALQYAPQLQQVCDSYHQSQVVDNNMNNKYNLVNEGDNAMKNQISVPESSNTSMVYLKKTKRYLNEESLLRKIRIYCIESDVYIPRSRNTLICIVNYVNEALKTYMKNLIERLLRNSIVENIDNEFRLFCSGDKLESQFVPFRGSHIDNSLLKVSMNNGRSSITSTTTANDSFIKYYIISRDDKNSRRASIQAADEQIEQILVKSIQSETLFDVSLLQRRQRKGISAYEAVKNSLQQSISISQYAKQIVNNNNNSNNTSWKRESKSIQQSKGGGSMIGNSIPAPIINLSTTNCSRQKISVKNLQIFMESDPVFRKSRILLKSYLS